MKLISFISRANLGVNILLVLYFVTLRICLISCILILSIQGQIYVMRQIMEKSNEHDIDLHIWFIDFKQAFNNVNRFKVNNAFEELEGPKKLRNRIRMTIGPGAHYSKNW